MARKTLTLTIETPAPGTENRDAGKMFLLTEMGAVRAEKWATRALLAIGRSGSQIPESVQQAGMAGLAAIGLRALAGLAFVDAEPLLDEMLGCVEIIPDPSRPQIKRTTIPDDFEEITTLVRLREEVLSLHLGFSIAAWRSRLIQAARMEAAMAGSSNTPTSVQ